MLSALDRLPMVDETWGCYGRHPRSGKRHALMVWRREGEVFGGVVEAPDLVAHARALERLFDERGLEGVPKRVIADDAEIARLLLRLLDPLGVEVRLREGFRPLDVDAFAADVILDGVARAAAPRWTSQGCVDRFRDGLAALRLDEGWMRLPLNLSVVVEGLESQPFGLLVHADCCPGFTVLPLDEAGRARGREGIVVLRFQQSALLGVDGRWPVIVEELAAPNPADVFRKQQRRLSVQAMERVEACMEIVVGLGAEVTSEMVLQRSVHCPIRVGIERCDLGVMSTTIPFGEGEQHVRLRAS